MFRYILAALLLVPAGLFAIDPKDAKTHGNLGIVLSHKGQWDEAIASYKKAIAIDPKFAKGHDGLGAALVGKGQWDAAIASCRQAIALDPKNGDAYNGRGFARATRSRKSKLSMALF